MGQWPYFKNGIGAGLDAGAFGLAACAVNDRLEFSRRLGTGFCADVRHRNPPADLSIRKIDPHRINLYAIRMGVKYPSKLGHFNLHEYTISLISGFGLVPFTVINAFPIL